MRTHIRAVGRGIVLTAVGISVATLTGCVSDDAAAPTPRPRAVEPPSETAEVGAILLSAEKYSKDTDGNRFLDTISPVTVYLFPGPNDPPVPFHRAGSMTFTLKSIEGDFTIARWTFDEDALAAARGSFNDLDGYYFALDIQEVSDDRVLYKLANLWCSFTPTDGKTVSVKGPVTVQVGRSGAP